MELYQFLSTKGNTKNTVMPIRFHLHFWRIQRIGLFLICCLLLVFFCPSCSDRQASESNIVEKTALQSEEHFLVNNQGDTIPTGVPIPAKGKWINPDSVAKPKVVPLKGTPKVVPAHTNVYPAGTPKVVQIPKELIIITPGKNGIPLPKTIPSKGKVVPVSHSQSIPALVPQMRNSAISNTQYLDIKDQLQDIVQGLTLGANDYLPKPFHKEELLARINTQLDLHRIFSVAGHFVPNEFLHSLNRNRITEVLLGDHTEKEVTVLFLDIRGYTALSETMTPEENFRFVNAFHGRMGPVIQKHKGFVNQYLGDAIMAIFPTNPETALQAAIDMQKQLVKYNEERSLRGRQLIKMGIGLHTGQLIMGIIGDKNRLDAATIADTVYTASRIEGLTKYYGASILLTEDSLEKMENKADFHLRYLGQVLVKGKKNPIGIYECFDGDAPTLFTHKHNTTTEFKTGLNYYFNRDFPEASGSFSKVLKSNPEDKVAELFLNKAGRYIHEGVADDWEGVEEMTFK